MTEPPRPSAPMPKSGPKSGPKSAPATTQRPVSAKAGALPEISAEEIRRRQRTERWSRPLITPRDRLSAWIDMLISDNGLFRLIYPNLHQVADGVWRSGQPTPGRLRAFARRGGRSVVSLRAGRGFGSLPLELAACSKAGLTYHNLELRARDLPSREELRAAAQVFQTIERPVLLHCQSGADRAGMASALYLILAEDRPVAEARRQLALRYGHNRFNRAGILDAFFDAYEHDTAQDPMSMADWAETRYDRDRITAEFKTNFKATPLRSLLRARLTGRS
jgi:protein tyrosine phosphatase (PTP) superfamily phosphohydrolase (DUF442 family)